MRCLKVDRQYFNKYSIDYWKKKLPEKAAFQMHERWQRQILVMRDCRGFLKILFFGAIEADILNYVSKVLSFHFVHGLRWANSLW